MMLSRFTRRVALSAHSTTATYSRILSFPASSLRPGAIAGVGLRTGAVLTLTNPKRNTSTNATAATEKTQLLTESTMAGRTSRRRGLTPEQRTALEKKVQEQQLDMANKAAALRIKKKKQVERERDDTARMRARLAGLKNRLAEAKKENKTRETKARDAKNKKADIITPPPRRMNQFSMFLQETKKSVQEAAAAWNNLTEEEKQKYAAASKVITAKRKEEFDAFLKTLTPADVRRYNRHRRAISAPRIRVKFDKRPLPPFLSFVRVFRTQPDQAGKYPIEVAKAAGAAWRSLTQAEKDQYKPKPIENENDPQSV